MNIINCDFVYFFGEIAEIDLSLSEQNLDYFALEKNGQLTSVYGFMMT
jgi:hypothetical protein